MRPVSFPSPANGGDRPCAAAHRGAASVTHDGSAARRTEHLSDLVITALRPTVTTRRDRPSSRSLRIFDVATQEIGAASTNFRAPRRRRFRRRRCAPEHGAASALLARGCARDSGRRASGNAKNKRAIGAFRNFLARRRRSAASARRHLRCRLQARLRARCRRVRCVIRMNPRKNFCVDVLTVGKLVFSFRPTQRLCEYEDRDRDQKSEHTRRCRDDIHLGG